MIVLFYDEAVSDTREHQGILNSLEMVDDKLDKLNGSRTVFVKFSHKEVAYDEFGLSRLPSLVYFENQIPLVYDGKLAAASGGTKRRALFLDTP